MTVDSSRVGADSARTLSKLFTSLDQKDRHELAGLFALMHARPVQRGDIEGAPVFALICPGVALSVSLQFLINKGFVAAGLLISFSMVYWIFSVEPLVVMVVTIIVFMRLSRNFAEERANLGGHEHALGS